MRKGLWLIVIMLLFTACGHDEWVEEKKVYNNFVNELLNAESDNFNKPFPFDINVYLDKVMESEITFRVIIDNPRDNIRNIRAIAIHDQETRDIFPTSGIFDEQLSLIPDVINLSSNYVGGVILVGYIPFNGEVEEFKGKIMVLVEYEDESSNINKIFYRYQK